MLTGFWIRLLSDIIDIIILWIVSAIIAYVFKLLRVPFLAEPNTVLLITVFLYIGILNSKVGQGQSIAKRLLNIQVVKLDGTLLSLPMSFLRSLVLMMTFFLNIIITSTLGILCLEWTHLLFIGTLIVFIFFSVGYIFLISFHPAKRGLHDLITGTIVIRKGTYQESLVEKNKQAKSLIFVLYFAIVSLLFCGYKLYSNTAVKTLKSFPTTEISRELNNSLFLKDAKVMIKIHNSKQLTIDVMVPSDIYNDDKQIANQMVAIKKIINEKFPDVRIENYQISESASVGIIKGTRTKVFNFGLHNKSDEAKQFIDLAVKNKQEGKCKDAIGYYTKTLEIFEKTKNKHGIAACYGNIGIMYLELQKYREAIKYCEKALKQYESVEDKINAGANLVNIAVAYSYLNEYFKAKQFYEQSLDIYREIGQKKEISRILLNLGILYYSHNEWHRALKCLNESLELKKEIGDSTEIVGEYISKASEKIQGKY
ncbi:MAG: tetratricopeptide repeat protein [Elusimicrobiota bacterium]